MRAFRSLLKSIDDQTRRLEHSYGGILLPIATAVLIVMLLSCTIMLSGAVAHPPQVSDPTGLNENSIDRLETGIESPQMYLELATAEMMLGHCKSALRALVSYERLMTGTDRTMPPRAQE
ncbi:MAG: hypothetical protein JW990_03700 [Thermoleophilia bacterium]|nr:hypothetical protein [Thermoleophilia bacterium]